MHPPFYLIVVFLCLCAFVSLAAFILYLRTVDGSYLGSPRTMLGVLQFWFVLLPLPAMFAVAYYTLLGPTDSSGSPVVALFELPIKMVLYPYFMWVPFALTLAPSVLFGLMQQLQKAELTILYNSGFQRRYVLCLPSVLLVGGASLVLGIAVWLLPIGRASLVSDFPEAINTLGGLLLGTGLLFYLSALTVALCYVCAIWQSSWNYVKSGGPEVKRCLCSVVMLSAMLITFCERFCYVFILLWSYSKGVLASQAGLLFLLAVWLIAAILGCRILFGTYVARKVLHGQKCK